MSLRASDHAVLVIRPADGARATAEALVEAGFHPAVAPLVWIEQSRGRLPKGPFDAIAVTSAEAVKALPYAGALDRAIPLFAVGAATAAAARAAGFTQVTAADGSVDSLIPLLPGQGRILYPHGDPVSRDLRPLVPGLVPWRAYRQRAYPLKQPPRRYWNDHGEQRSYLPPWTFPVPQEMLTRLKAGRIRHVLVYSAFQAEALAKLIRIVPGFDQVTAYAMSARSAAPLAKSKLAGIRIASSHSEAAILDLLRAEYPEPLIADDPLLPALRAAPVDDATALFYLKVATKFIEGFYLRDGHPSEAMEFMLMMMGSDRAADGKPYTYDPAFWADWQEAIAKVRRGDHEIPAESLLMRRDEG